jgi:hypothetical protein
MRVKLSYTVDEEDVLSEGAKLIGLCADDMQQCIELFKGLQDELRGENTAADSVVNTPKALDMVEEFRRALFSVDMRLSEVMEIIQGYSAYKDQERSTTPTIPSTAPTPVTEAE